MVTLKDIVIKTTRKNYRCEWCGETIDAGSSCNYVVELFDGFNAYRLHLECDAASAAYFSQSWLDSDEGFLPYQNPRGMYLNLDDEAQVPSNGKL